MQSDETISHVHSWKPCMTLHHMCILHWCSDTNSALSFACVNAVFFFIFTSVIQPPFLFPRRLSLSPPFLFLSVFVCACVHMTSIWWIKSNALILSQTRPLLHERSDVPPCEKPHPSACHPGRRETMQQQGSFC